MRPKLSDLLTLPLSLFLSHCCCLLTTAPVLLALASQRIESDIFDFDISLNSEAATKRGAPPTLIEMMVLPWVLGLIWSEIKQLWELGLADYLSDMWNILDFITNSLYVATITLRVIAYLQVSIINIQATTKKRNHFYCSFKTFSSLSTASRSCTLLHTIYFTSVNMQSLLCVNSKAFLSPLLHEWHIFKTPLLHWRTFAFFLLNAPLLFLCST